MSQWQLWVYLQPEPMISAHEYLQIAGSYLWYLSGEHIIIDNCS